MYPSNAMLRRQRARKSALVLVVLAALATVSSCDAPRTGANTAADAARSMIGRPYVYGGNSPSSGFDCSGLTSWSWQRGGKTLPRTATDQYWSSTRIGRDQLQPGDLVFYGYSGNIQHVAIYVGNAQMVSASNPTRPVELVSVDEWWSGARIGFGRV